MTICLACAGQQVQHSLVPVLFYAVLALQSWAQIELGHNISQSLLDRHVRPMATVLLILLQDTGEP